MIPSLTAIHFLITYGCSAECDHCFIWGTPRRSAAMTVEQVDSFLDQMRMVETIKGVCAEGGESFTRYDVVLHFLRGAKARGLEASALTNASWVQSRQQAEERIAEMMAAGLTNLGISTDQWHRQSVPVERVDTLLEVCSAAGLGASRMETTLEGVMFRGRAAERLAAGRPTKPTDELTKCPHEDLAAPGRVHLDCYGNLHLCQGLVLGRAPIPEAVAAYDPASHPIVRLILEGGPSALGRYAATLGFDLAPGYVDACHLCYRAREFLRPHFPELLGPDEMYGA
ncbi:MAG: radical SAM protein [Armatimonadota bacterium]